METLYSLVSSIVLTGILYYVHVYTKYTDQLVTLLGRKTAMTDTIVFSVVHVLVLYLINTYVFKFIEPMGNYGTSCPNGYAMKEDQTCVPIGRATYEGKNY